MDQVTSCSVSSYNANEPLYATVSPTRYWFMLEVDRPWGAKALFESNLPPDVIDHLSATTKQLDSGRVLLLRQQIVKETKNINFFIAIADELNPTLFAFGLEKYEDLLDLNLPELVSKPETLADNLQDQPMYLVCTNGRRDPCCALNGLPVYQSLANTFGAAVWQTSHVGGHRYSANMVCMPHALCYGRVDSSSAPKLVRAYEQGNMIPEYYRGRGCYQKGLQAAEYFIRSQYQLLKISALKFVEFSTGTDNKQVSVFTNEERGERFTVSIRYEPDAYSILTSCRDVNKSSADVYHLIDIEKT